MGGQNMTTLTPNKCHRAAPGRHYDGTVPGLHLYVRALATGTVSRGWVLRIRADGRRRDIGLGRFPDVSLDRVRRLAMDTRQACAEGRDVVAERKADVGVPTFAMAAQIVADIKNAARRRDDGGGWLALLKRHAFPRIGNLPVDRITKANFLAVIQPLWQPANRGGKPATAKALRVAVKNVLEWAEEQGHIETNPACGSFKQSLPPLKQGHRNAVTGADAPAIYQTITTANGNTAPATRLCLRLIALTAVRKTEARAARWDEIDMDAAVWTIPGERMKTGKPHRVPLSREAVAVLTEARALDNGFGHVFPATTVSRSSVRPPFHSFKRALRRAPLCTAGAPPSAIGQPKTPAHRTRLWSWHWPMRSGHRWNAPMPARTCSTSAGRSWRNGRTT